MFGGSIGAALDESEHQAAVDSLLGMQLRLPLREMELLMKTPMLVAIAA